MPFTAAPSRLTVLLLTDIVGSTDLKTRLGLSEYSRLLARHDATFQELIASVPSAEILKDTGDGYFASFSTTSDAVRFALRFQEALRRENWPGEALRVRVGIHVGEVAELEKESTGKPKIVGLAADIASRVTQLASGGQILLTRFAFNEARQFVSSVLPLPPGEGRGEGARENQNGSPDLKWIAHGPYLFKGNDDPVEIFEVGADGFAPLSAPANTDSARRAVPIDADQTLGWRPAVGLDVPEKPQWALERRLGEGGCGEVWLARHKKLPERRVFKFCFDSDRLRSLKRELALFRVLREALGDRSDIARINEIKLDEPPYFLESDYADGGNLRDWSDMEGGIDKVPLATRLDLVARVADAVAAAHSVGVLHKDIKPSNVLIALDAGQPRPKLADFGIGVLTDPSRLRPGPVTVSGFTQHTTQESTQTGTRIYAPPEVLVGRPFTVQGDVYALGVMLYQMVVADLDRPLAEGWGRDVEDDLLRDDIALCVDGDPTRRLGSAAELARRLRSLAGRRAGAEQAARAQLAAARRRRLTRAALVAASLLLVLLIAAAALVWRERSLRRVAENARRAEADQRRIADEIGNFLMNMLLSVAPDTQQGRDVTVLQALDAAATQLKAKTWHPEVEAYLRDTLGSSYRAVGEPQLAEPHARRAVELIAPIKGEAHPDTYNFRANLGMVLFEMDDAGAAEPLLRDAASNLARLLGPEHKDTLDTINDHILVLLQSKREDEAEPLIEKLLEIYTRTRGPEHSDTLDVMGTRAGLLYQRERFDEAAEVFGRLYEARRRSLGEDHPSTILSAHNYASLLHQIGRADEGIELMRRVVESQKRAVGPEHPRTLNAIGNLAQMLEARGRAAEAIELLRALVATRTSKFGAEHADTLWAAGLLGGMLANEGRADEAEPVLRETIELQLKQLPASEPRLISAMSALGSALQQKGRLDEAEKLCREALARAQERFGRQHANTNKPRIGLGSCLIDMKRYDQAEQLLLEALNVAQDPASPSKTQAGKTAAQLVRLYEAWQQPQKAAQYRALVPASSQPTTATASGS